MCGRYGFVPTKNTNLRFKIKNQLKFEENKNCSPGSMLPVIMRALRTESPELLEKYSPKPRTESPKKSIHSTFSAGGLSGTGVKNPENEAILMRWGLIPSWANPPAGGPKISYKMINARADTLMQKPSFKKPFLTQRCLIPATGFYEWQHIEEKKIPYYFKLKSGDLFAFAGLYDEWKNLEGYPLKTFTIITTEPNEIVAPVHNRMPVILPEKSEDIWLDNTISDPQKLLSLLTPYKSFNMEVEKIEKLTSQPPLFL